LNYKIRKILGRIIQYPMRDNIKANLKYMVFSVVKSVVVGQKALIGGLL
jgi:hypothetical protein